MNEQGFHGYHDRILLETRKQSLEVNIGTTELFGTSYYQASFPKITRGGLLKNFCFWLERTSWLWTHKETQRKWEKSLWRSSAVEHPDPLSTCFFPKCILCNSVDLASASAGMVGGWWRGGFAVSTLSDRKRSCWAIGRFPRYFSILGRLKLNCLMGKVACLPLCRASEGRSQFEDPLPVEGPLSWHCGYSSPWSALCSNHC